MTVKTNIVSVLILAAVLCLCIYRQAHPAEPIIMYDVMEFISNDPITKDPLEPPPAGTGVHDPRPEILEQAILEGCADMNGNPLRRGVPLARQHYKCSAR